MLVVKIDSRALKRQRIKAMLLDAIALAGLMLAMVALWILLPS